LAGQDADAKAIDDAGDDEHGLCLNSTHDDGSGDEDCACQHHRVSAAKAVTDPGRKERAEQTSSGQGRHDAALSDRLGMGKVVFVL
jgi:hypothetical protein